MIIVDNLKPARLRGVKSQGMLLAASDKDSDGNERVEVLFVDTPPGTAVVPADTGTPAEPAKRIDIDTFFSIPIRAVSGTVKVGNAELRAGDAPVTTSTVTDGAVG